MDHCNYPEVKRPFLDTRALSSPLGHESESESSEVSGSETPSPSARPSARFPSFTPPLEENGSSETSPNLEAESSKGWYEFDLSVILALVSPIGNWLTGGDHVKNFLLVLLLIFYLHQIIEVPWSLYHLSRPRRRSPDVPPHRTSEQDPYHQIASSELHKLEIFYLFLTILSPLLGVAILRVVIISVAGPETITWFSTSLFILATGMRPWKHAVERLRQRTKDLHTVIHYPPASSPDTQSQIEALAARVAELEAQLKECNETVKALTEDVFDHVEGAVEGLDKSMRKQEKKNDAFYSAQELRLATLEQNMEALLERKEISGHGSTLSYNLTSAFHATMAEPLALIFPEWARSSRRDKHPPSPRSSPKIGRSRTATKLETIPEGATFTPKRVRYRFPSLRIPGLKFVLRIGDLATLPVRRVVAYLLMGRVYEPNAPTSSL
ncbi:hypothetical protein DEU56DRAFT_874313 [Suillus clintonianus]|uniref:uncharacterized protein n=1 Tax=Suillus clintonianus TaxID=1904413 RepID=UPI001B860623|nr:uncharacterized protein DEU56DRAFT_874313 [Suillus clintonianus]KAG2114413.1 hypothetical protein DEU56DRAFT_874313 [Suillus clintonianus]